MKFFLYRFVLITFFALVLILIIGFARGYRLNWSQQTVEPTGILVASSEPDGAKILVNGQLKGATNSNISVKPGEYDVEIAQDGYLSWKKKLIIKGELVMKADALLFPINPSLSPVTSFGVVKAFATNTQEKVIIISDTGDAEKDGIYLLDNGSGPLARLNSQKLLILKSLFPAGLSLQNVSIEFSPDERQMLVSIFNPPLPTPALSKISRGKKLPTPEATLQAIYLLPTDGATTNLFEVTGSVEAIREAWQQEHQEIKDTILETFKKPIAQTAHSLNILAFSPDETKILYVATESASLPQVIKPPLVAANQTPEEREIKPGGLYVYDKKEDKNFKITPSFKPALHTFWYVDSQHVVLREDEGIAIVDYDGTNKRLVYSGPFQEDFMSTSRDGKLLILTNFNSSTRVLPDVYGVGIL